MSIFQKLLSRLHLSFSFKRSNLKLKPHEVGPPLRYWTNTALSVMIVLLVTVLITFGIIQLAQLFGISIARGVNGDGQPLHLLWWLLVVPFAIWGYRNSKMLLAYVSDYQEKVLLGTSAFLIGFSERGEVADGAAFLKRIRIFAALIIIPVTIGPPIFFFLFSSAGTVGPIKTAVYFSTVLLAFTGYGKVVIGKSKGLLALSQRIELKPLQPYSGVPARQHEVIQLSDLHITISCNAPVAENEELLVSDSNLDTLARMIADRPGIPVIISGDTTDTGNPKEWIRFEDKFGQFKDRLVLAPGNHDLNIVGYGESGLWNTTDKWHYKGRIVRLRAYLKTAIALMPNRVSTLTCEDSAAPRGLIPLDAAFKAIADNPGSRQFQELSNLFPLVVNFDAAGTPAIAIVWNSTRSSALPWWNSLGAIDAGQLERFEVIRELLTLSVNEQLLVHVVHHKVGMPVDIVLHMGQLTEWKHKIQFASMTMQNPWSIVEAVSSPAKDTVILHGHHHVTFCASVAEGEGPIVDVISAPSSTLPCEGHMRGAERVQVPGFDLITLGVNSQGTRVIAPPQWNHSL